MNLPNKLTVLRLVFIPFYVFFLLTDFFKFSTLIAGIIFALASLTDFADGKIARAKNLVTDFGKFADPLADKILVMSAMVCFVKLGRLYAWVCIIILAREFAVSGLRLIVAGKGTVLAASRWGKYKTAFQMFMCVFMTLDMEAFGAQGIFLTVYNIITMALMYVSLILTIISMIDYFYKNRGSISSM